MKTIVRILMTAAAVMMLANFANAQIEEVCASSQDERYTATGGDAGSSYIWKVYDPFDVEITGTVIDGADDEINVQIDWPATAGTYRLEVQEVVAGCASAALTATVLVHALPTATIVDATPTVCSGETATVAVTLGGSSLVGSWDNWTITWAIDAGDQATFTDVETEIVGDVYTFTPTMTVSGAITISEVYDGRCSNTGSGTISVTVPTFGTTGISPI
jgi:hypothetical protein